MVTVTATVVAKDGDKELKQDYSKILFAPEAKSTDAVKEQFAGKSDADLLKEAIGYITDKVLPKDKDGKPVGSPVVELLQGFTYAYDLGIRSKIRQQIVSAAAGPDKAIEKAVQDFMKARAAMGKPVTEEAARAKVKAMLEE